MPKVVSELIEVYVFRIHGQERQYLLLQRSADDGLYPNMWQIITGTLHTNENTMAGALRELQEETQLSYKRLWSVPTVNSFYDVRNDVVQMVPLFAVEVDDSCEPILSNEHQHYRWVSYEEAIKEVAWPTQKWGLKVIHDYIGTQEAASQYSEIVQLNRKDKQ